jgi:O-antigen/teichoic acid export membrane protein
MVKKLIEKLLGLFIKDEQDRARLSTVIIPSFIVRLGFYVLSYLLLIVLTRTLGPRRYGIYSYAASILFLLMNFSSYGFEVIAVKYTSSYLSKGQKGLWKGLYIWVSRLLAIISVAVAAGTALFIWVFVYILHIIPKEDYTLPILVCCSIIPVYSLMNFYSNLLRGQGKTLISFLPDHTVKPLFLLVSLVVFRYLAGSGSMSLHVAIGLNIASFIMAFIFIFMVFRRINNFKEIKAEYDKPGWRSFVGSLFILTCVSSVYNQLDILMLRLLKDSSQVGMYRAAERMSSALFFFMAVMNMIIMPVFARLNYREDKEKLQRMITRTIRWVMLFSLPVFIVLVGFSGQVMKLSGSEFVPGKTALVILCCAHLLDICFGPVGNFALMTGNEKYTTRYMAIGIFINIAVNLMLTPTMGLNGTAIATACYIVFWNAAMFITIRKKTGIRTWIFG